MIHDFHKLGFTYSNESPDLCEMRELVLEHSQKMQEMRKEEKEKEIKLKWKQFQTGKVGGERRLSSRLSFVGGDIIRNTTASPGSSTELDNNVVAVDDENTANEDVESCLSNKKDDTFESLKYMLNVDIESEIVGESDMDEYKAMMSQIDRFTTSTAQDFVSNEMKRDPSRAMTRKTVWCEEALRSAFNAVDDDKSGTLSIDEVANLMAALSPKSRKSVKVRQREAAELIVKFDEDNDNALDFDEFKKLMKEYSSDNGGADDDVDAGYDNA